MLSLLFPMKTICIQFRSSNLSYTWSILHLLAYIKAWPLEDEESLIHDVLKFELGN